MTIKLFLYSFSSPNVYQTFFYNVCIGQTNWFYFCPHFYDNFISDRILHQSIMNLKMKSAVVVWRVEEICVLKQMLVARQKNILSNWKNFWFSTTMFSIMVHTWRILIRKFLVRILRLLKKEVLFYSTARDFEQFNSYW